MTCCGRVSALAALPCPALFVLLPQTDTMFAFIYKIKLVFKVFDFVNLQTCKLAYLQTWS
jgi:hypothetical protein